jgi:hypothetical protein
VAIHRSQAALGGGGSCIEFPWRATRIFISADRLGQRLANSNCDSFKPAPPRFSYWVIELPAAVLTHMQGIQIKVAVALVLAFAGDWTIHAARSGAGTTTG